jgi:adenylylsulfate kinase-like enzyme
MIILLYGQPASGKTTLSNELMRIYDKENAIQIDGDKWRDVTKNKDYSKEGRLRNLKGAFDMALYLERERYMPILSFVTPYEEYRKYLADNSKRFVEIYLFYNEDEDRGRNMNFAKDFEKPTTNFLSLNTSLYSVEQCINEILVYLGYQIYRTK